MFECSSIRILEHSNIKNIDIWRKNYEVNADSDLQCPGAGSMDTGEWKLEAGRSLFIGKEITSTDSMYLQDVFHKNESRKIFLGMQASIAKLIVAIRLTFLTLRMKVLQTNCIVQ